MILSKLDPINSKIIQMLEASLINKEEHVIGIIKIGWRIYSR